LQNIEDNCIAEVAVKFNACPKPGETSTGDAESELQTRVDTGVSPTEPLSEDSTKSMLALRMRRSELPAAINKDHCPNAALDDNKFFSFNELGGLNTPDPHPEAGTSDTASSSKNKRNGRRRVEQASKASVVQQRYCWKQIPHWVV